jgi:hypothetical protein
MVSDVGRGIGNIYVRIGQYCPGIVGYCPKNGTARSTLAIEQRCRENQQTKRQNACRRGHDLSPGDVSNLVELRQRFRASRKSVLESAPAPTVVALHLGADTPIGDRISSTCKEHEEHISQ